MQMPKGAIAPALFAPCGSNCLVCYRHCAHKTPCAGCRMDDAEKPAHCRRCAIRSCVVEKGLTHCHACPAFPCKRIQALEQSYRKRYAASLVENSRYVQAHGLSAFMQQQKRHYTCAACGGVISLHTRACSQCQGPMDR